MSVYTKQVISLRNNQNLKKKTKHGFENTTFHSYFIIDVHLMLCKNLV